MGSSPLCFALGLLCPSNSYLLIPNYSFIHPSFYPSHATPIPSPSTARDRRPFGKIPRRRPSAARARATVDSSDNSVFSGGDNSGQNVRGNDGSSGDGGGDGGAAPHDHGAQDAEALRIRWTDRVALQAQVGTAADTLEVLLAALRNNKAWADVGLPGDTRRKDEGLEALYTYANFDVWDIRSNFFGRSLDLGQFERFKRVMVSSPYDITLSGEHEVLSHVKPTVDIFVCRVLFRDMRRDDTVFKISMSRVRRGSKSEWMVDSLIHDPVAYTPAEEAV